MMAEQGILAADLGGTLLRVAVFNADAEMLMKEIFRTDPEEPDQLRRALSRVREASSVPLAGAVIGAPGVVSYNDGRMLGMANLPLWQGRLTRDWLSEALNLPAILANDADLGGLGEHRFGAGVGVQDMLYVTSSTGVGAGVIIGGRLLQGHSSLAEGGHMIIDRKTHETVEDLGSGSALERLTGVRGAETTEAAKAGDQAALEAVATVAGALAIGVHNLVHCFMPQRVVVGGGFALGAGDLALGPIQAELASCQRGCFVSGEEVRLAIGGDDVGLYGALALGLDSVASLSR